MLTTSSSGAFGGVLAYGIGHLDGTWGYRGWRFIYVIEGLITFLVGVVAVFTLQETPAKTKGWLTEQDKRFLELRAKFMYGGGALKTKNEFAWPDVIKALKVSPSWVKSVGQYTKRAVCSHLGDLTNCYLQHHGTLRVLAIATNHCQEYGLHGCGRSRSVGSAVHLCQHMRRREWFLQ